MSLRFNAWGWGLRLALGGGYREWSGWNEWKALTQSTNRPEHPEPQGRHRRRSGRGRPER